MTSTFDDSGPPQIPIVGLLLLLLLYSKVLEPFPVERKSTCVLARPERVCVCVRERERKRERERERERERV